MSKNRNSSLISSLLALCLLAGCISINNDNDNKSQGGSVGSVNLQASNVSQNNQNQRLIIALIVSISIFLVIILILGLIIRNLKQNIKEHENPNKKLAKFIKSTESKSFQLEQFNKLERELHEIKKRLRQSVYKFKNHKTELFKKVDDTIKTLNISGKEQSKNNTQRIANEINSLKTIYEPLLNELEELEGLVKSITDYLDLADEMDRTRKSRIQNFLDRSYTPKSSQDEIH